MSLNFNKSLDKLADKFTAEKFNWENENSDQYNKNYAPFDMVYERVFEKLKAKNTEKIRKINLSASANPVHNNARVKVQHDSALVAVTGQYLTQLIASSQKKNQSKAKQLTPGVKT